ncbi:MAG: FRG domain-containing protein [Betaproteobacteria bacterium]|nr:FRG domain-containing protein [Betaproteobacteria bacterium]
MPFPATEESPKSWCDLVGIFATLKGEWLFRGAMAGWDAEPSLERVCTHWGISFDKAPDAERKLLREFKRHPEAKGLPGDPDDALEWFSLMQHYGAPTRLLDWSYSPYTALFFALDHLLNSKPDPDPVKDPKAAIWAVRAAWFDEALSHVLSAENLAKLDAYRKAPIKLRAAAFRALFLEANPRIAFVYPVNPRYLNERLSVQQGVFLCPGDVSQSFMDNLSNVGFLADPANARSIILSRAVMSQCFESLHRMNVSARSLYPGLAGYAQWLKHRIPYLPDVPL